MKLSVGQWGNSAGLRLPRAVLDELRIGPGSELEASVRGGVLRLRPVPPVTSFRLDDLMDRLTPDTIPAFETWPPVGHEVIDDDFTS